jgi:hypothetical protein
VKVIEALLRDVDPELLYRGPRCAAHGLVLSRWFSAARVSKMGAWQGPQPACDLLPVPLAGMDQAGVRRGEVASHHRCDLSPADTRQSATATPGGLLARWPVLAGDDQGCSWMTSAAG